jgi:hypothetical protein
MATIVRPTETDDDGTGTTGTIHNAAWLTALLDAVDTALRGLTIVTPSTVTADQNNYNPTGLSTAQVLRVATDASRTITGIVAQTGGRRLIIANAGAQNIVLAHQSGSSSSANRINCLGAANLTVGVAESVELFYDDVSGFWRTLVQA